MGFANSIIGGAAALIRAAIRSPNYVTGTAGWTINKDGSAEFNNLVVRGTFDGTDFEVNSSGIFIYSGVPALGNLIGSIASAAGTDAHGNPYLDGVCSYGTSGVVQLTQGRLEQGPSQTAVGGGLAASTDGSVAGKMIIDSGLVSGGDADAALILESNLASGAGTVCLVSAATTIVKGPVVAQLPGSSPATAETWHSLGAYPSGTTTRGQYRLTSEGKLELDINLTGTPASGTSSFPNTMPASYQPAVTKRIPATQGSGGVGWVTVSTAGVVSCTIANNGTATFDCPARVELT